jgi:hypothetical protein
VDFRKGEAAGHHAGANFYESGRSLNKTAFGLGRAHRGPMAPVGAFLAFPTIAAALCTSSTRRGPKR